LSEFVGINPLPPGQDAPPAPPGLDPAILNGTVVPTEDGGAEVWPSDDGEPAPMPEVEWFGNLAEHIDPAALNQIAQEVCDGIDADVESNASYREEMDAILAMAATTPEPRQESDKPFADASDVVHPMMLEAIVRFVANAHTEMLPAAGPARSKIMATPAGNADEVASRRQGWINYYLTTVDKPWYSDFEAGLLKCSIWGSVFRKAFRDPVTQQPKTRHLTPDQLVVGYTATTLEEAPRFTHLETDLSEAEVRRRVFSGYYPEDTQYGTNLGAASSFEDRANQPQVGGQQERSNRPEDQPYLHAHCHCWLTLEGTPFALTGDMEGLPIPVIVTVDKNARRALRVERDWDKTDHLYKRRQTVFHYKFHPGTGFYGWGLGHLMRSSTDQATWLWRLAIDTMQLNAFPGGFKARGIKSDDSSITIGPGQFVEIDAPGGNIRNAIMSLGEVYRDVPASWAPIFQAAVDQGQRLGMTTELQVGEGNANAPVGSTIALIEQAIRPQSAVLKRLHAVFQHELQALCRMFAAEPPTVVYPYITDGVPARALAADFADETDIIPVSDPNQPTQVQRIAMAQAVHALATSNPEIDRRAALADVLKTLGKSQAEIQALMPQVPQGQPADPATELGFAVKSMPLKAGVQQDHLAHIRVHVAQAQMPGLPPLVVAALVAHAGEHLALYWSVQQAMAAAQMGVQIMPGQPLPPEIEGQVAQAVAQNSAQIVQQLMAALGQPADASKMAELAQKERDSQRKDAADQRKAEAQARQDQGEFIRQQEEVQADAAARADDLAARAIELEAQREQNASAERVAMLDHASAAVKAEADRFKATKAVEARAAAAQRPAA
jgi:hypothetical protein